MAYIPDWLQGVISTMQEKSDAKYKDEVANYNAAAADWIKANVISRNIGQPVTPFTKTAPVRVIFGADENLNLTQTEAPAEVTPPVLPPQEELTPGVPVSEWVNPGRAAVKAQDDLMAAIYAKVSAIAVKVGA